MLVNRLKLSLRHIRVSTSTRPYLLEPFILKSTNIRYLSTFTSEYFSNESNDNITSIKPKIEGQDNTSESIRSTGRQKSNPNMNLFTQRLELFNTIKHIPEKIKDLVEQANKNNDANTNFVDAANTHSGLFIRQLKIEEEQQFQAGLTYHEMLQQLMKTGQGTGLKMVQRILLKWYEPMCEAISAEIKLVQQGVPGMNRMEIGPALMLIPIEKIAVIALDLSLSMVLKRGNLNVLVTPLAVSIGNLIENEVNLLKLKHGTGNLNYWERVMIANAVANKKYSMKVNTKLRKILDVDEWS